MYENLKYIFHISILQAAEHYYLHTKPIEGLTNGMPVVRDLDGHIYFREKDGRIIGGGFETVAKPAFIDGELPGKYDFKHIAKSNLSYKLVVFFLNFIIILSGKNRKINYKNIQSSSVLRYYSFIIHVFLFQLQYLNENYHQTGIILIFC